MRSIIRSKARQRIRAALDFKEGTIMHQNCLSQCGKAAVLVCLRYFPDNLRKLILARFRANHSIIRPSVEIVTTCQGIILPLFCSAARTACSMPPQQGTSIRTTVTDLMWFVRRMPVSFSL